MKKSLVLLVALFALALPAGAAAAPPLAATPDPVLAPKTTVGFAEDVFTVQLRNEEAEPVAVQNFAIGGADATEFGVQGYTCGIVQPGEKCEFSLWFAPDSVGLKQATLELTLYGHGVQQVSLEGQGVAPRLTWSPGGDFGLQSLDRGENRTFQLQNTGEAALSFENLWISGPDRDNFWISEQSCSQIPFSVLSPGQSCSVQVYFQPSQVRAYEAQLSVEASGAEFGAELSGEGGRPEVVPSASPLDLGFGAVGERGEARTVNLTNQGNMSGGFFIAVISSGDVGSFRLLSESCTMIELAPGSSCSARVRFEPQETGPLAARLMMFGDGEPTMIALEGQGVSASDASGPVAAQSAVPAVAPKVRHKRFGRGKGIHFARAKALRRAPLHAAAAR